ncbi:conserved hypothetical protein [Talaromyces stipitatus ATCC 10500]|uniref:Non-homologous end-joining factor 1 n=1 Tax=Talaromyces stipitatus (strain ATCC 10500 / CBS 375.48 / QM 6759 / NRRL 1006) TaxID=441959 RepID=B8MEG1_TALSN|nr:uncharacterized protein TSTA_016650 [Talaromyces stipitatus ATCC 10500]EED16588.1 conserved hypothetical protein [Talaromyces stipitatus ATCC 10500]
MSPQWHSLPTRNISVPPLLYRFIYTSQSYDFYLTDLTHIWRENLQHKHILQKAEDTETSIDPSEDANQYDVLMRKIQDALDGAKNTTVAVTSGRRSNSITVSTNTKLPGGLNPLKWSFMLSKEPPSAVTRYLLLPLLKNEKDHEQREQSLLEHIREKDNVLSKIFDKIDPSQLTSMFPGTAGVRHTKLKTSDLIRHIKGATKFEEKKWRGSPAEEDDLGSGLASAYGGTSLDSTNIRDVAWWENLGNGIDSASESPERSQTATKRKNSPPNIYAGGDKQKPADEDLSTEDEDEFQRQETPPHLKRKKDEEDRNPVKSSGSDLGVGTTESDADVKSDDRLDSRTIPVQKGKSPKKVMGRIGAPKAFALGHSRKGAVADETDSDDTPDTPRSRHRIPTPREDHEMYDGTESDSQPERVQTPSPPKTMKDRPTENAPKKKGVLSKIGGKKPEPKRAPSPEPPDKVDLERTPSDKDDDLQQRHLRSQRQSTPKKGKKLGLIGGKKKPQATTRTTSPKHEETDDDLDSGPNKSRKTQMLPSGTPSPHRSVFKSPSPVSCMKKPEPEPELSAEQKADKKREELKRQLDAKSKAPTKKKRKF